MSNVVDRWLKSGVHGPVSNKIVRHIHHAKVVVIQGDNFRDGGQQRLEKEVEIGIDNKHTSMRRDRSISRLATVAALCYNTLIRAIRSHLKFYPTYLYVISLDIGDDYYVPADFIAGRDPARNRVTLTATMADVMNRTWSRIPDFVARGQAREEILLDA